MPAISAAEMRRLSEIPLAGPDTGDGLSLEEFEQMAGYFTFETQPTALRAPQQSPPKRHTGNSLPFTFPGKRRVSSKFWTVAGLFGPGDLVAVYGPPGGGKSALLSDLAAHIAAGREWFGRKVEKSSALWVAAERRDATDRRLVAAARKLAADVGVAITGERLDIAVDGVVECLAATVAAVSAATGNAVGLIVIDTLSRAAPSLDENSTRDVARIVDRLAFLAASTGAAVAIVTHEAKSSGELRGSTAILGAVDCAIRVRKLKTGRVATIEKLSDGEDGAAVRFDLVPTFDGSTVTVEPLDVEEGGGGFKVARQPGAMHLPAQCALALSVLERIAGRAKSALLEFWRSEFYSQLEGKTSDAKRRAFHDARKRLSDAGLVGEVGDTVRLLDRPGREENQDSVIFSPNSRVAALRRDREDSVIHRESSLSRDVSFQREEEGANSPLPHANHGLNGSEHGQENESNFDPLERGWVELEITLDDF